MMLQRFARHLQLAPAVKKRLLSFRQIFQQHHSVIIDEEISMLQQLQTVVASIQNNSPDLSLLKDTLSGINDLFLIVVVGEFNSGKSSLINSLLGGNYLKTGVLPTTSKVHVLRYKENALKIWGATENLLLKDFEEVELPVDWLKHIAIIDTPGTNAIYSNHEKITQQVVPRSDLVLFVTSVERPISESEASFLRQICDWGKNVIIVVNKIDTISPSEREQVLAFVSHNTSSIIGTSFPVPIFGVSSRLGIQSKLSSHSGDDGNLRNLEKYLLSTLGQKQIIQMKLENPLNIADRVVFNCENILSERQEMLEGDRKVLQYIDENMALFQLDINKEVSLFRKQLQNIFHNLLQRGDTFLENNISIFKLELLYDPAAFETAFQREVTFDIGKPVDDLIVDVSNLILKRATTQVHAVGEYLGARPSRYSNAIVGQLRGLDETSSLFATSRQAVLERLRRDITTIIEDSKSSIESQEISVELKNCLNQIITIQSVSGVVTGGLFAAQFIDITGLLAASGFIGSTLLLLPFRKQAVKLEYSKRIKALSSKLDEVLAHGIESQLLGVNEKINDSIGPYSRFVRIESKKTADLLDDLKRVKMLVSTIRTKILPE